ncbi:MAG: pentapeptide repeat-containing protein [Candidatus Microsaccharimonas sp.]
MGYFNNEEDITEKMIEDQIGTGVQTRGLSISECLIVKSDLSAMNMERFDIVNTEIKNTNLSGSQFPSSSWRTVQIEGCRCSGLQIQDSDLKNIRFAHSKLDIVNFRLSKVENVIFEDCVIGDVDFYNATLKNVEFINCTISKVTFTSAKMKNVDLSKSTIEAINGIASLKGATISYDQLMQLAPYFAAEAGIKISTLE